ncbi:MAG: cyclase family protein, partial [Nitrospirae bacterium]|nr:cyclase family protein [Nitrospirota bacterium]
MSFILALLGILFLSILGACTGSSVKIVDLTFPFDNQTIYWPNNKQFEREETARGVTPKGYWYASGRFSASEHGG